jgi:phosphoglycolate phosphatase
MKNFIFDLDGTLVDSKIDIVNSFNLAIKKIINPELIKDPSLYIGYPVKDMLLNLYPDILPEKLKETIAEFRYIYDNSSFPNTKLYPYAIELLDNLKNNDIKMFILTNKPSTATFQILRKFALADYFKAIITKEHQSIKNKSELLKDLIVNFNLDRNEILLIGDSEVDVMASKANMVKIAVLKHGYGDYIAISKMKPDYIFNNLKEIGRIIKYE